MKKTQPLVHKMALISLLPMAALLAACGSTVDLKEPTAAAPVETRSTTGAAGAGAGAGATAGGAAQSGVTTVNLAPNDGADEAAMALARQRVVYFDFDSFAVRDEFRPVMQAHAKRLASMRDAKIVVEGHTDERGGREYNLALGQKRAEAVARTMEVLGAGSKQIEAVSFGKERPAAQGSSEESYAMNRRAEIKDR
jgi:peptidoglycan-associated lipoprotein